jgi:hypothetical protein
MKLGTIAALALTAAAALIPVSAWAQNDAPPSGLSAQGAVDQSYARNVPADVDSKLTSQSLSSASPTDEILPLAPRVANRPNAAANQSAAPTK